MSDQQSEADKIRNKRLAKLGSQATSAQADGTTDLPKPLIVPTTTELPKPKITIAKQGRNLGNPFSQLGLKTDGEPGAEGGGQPNPISTTPEKRDSSNIPRQPGNMETFEDWEDKILATLFRVTLQSNKSTDVHGHPLYYLSGVRAELEQGPSTMRMNTSLLEQGLIEAGSNQGKTKPLDYFLACWKRIARQSRSMRSGDLQDPKVNVIREARRLCMSYCIFAITIPDMFGQDASSSIPLSHHLLVDPENDRGICHDFLSEAVTRFGEDDSIKVALVEAMEQLSRELAKMSMNDNYKPYVMAMRNYVRYPALIQALAESPNFSPPNTTPRQLEEDTLLGPFFRLSPMQPVVALNYFNGAKTRDRGYIVNSQNALRLTLRTHQAELYDIADRFIKASKAPREKMLDWFATIVNLNHKRRAIRTDPRYISSDGFMTNITVCLDQLCEPFMDATFSKVNRIEVDYLRRSPRVNIKDETKINADQTAADAYYADKANGTSNFISEIFFLTVAAHHYGTEAIQSKLSSLRKDLKHMDKQLEKFEEERQKYAQSPMALAHFDSMFKKYKDQVEQGHCVYFATEGILLDDLSQARSMSFMRYVIVWLLRVVSGTEFPTQPIQLPLPQEQPDIFKNLPEYLIEDVVDHFKFLTSHMPHIISSTQCDELVMICITFLRSSEYIRNPYLKSGLVSILYYGVMPVRQSTKGILGDVLNALPFALKHLLHALMQFYIECESTGGHTQFYDKFNIRYEIFQVIKCIWSNVVYRENLATEARMNLDFFVQFVNLLLNDVTFVLDESFSAFHQISALTKELRDTIFDETAKQQKEEALEEAQGKAKSYMSLANETVSMLKLFTDALADSFTMPEVVQRLADMLDYNLDALVGPKQNNLNVENRAEYNFNPIGLLADIVDVYLNLGLKPNFHLAIARDGRSYKPANFTQTAVLLGRKGMKAPDELERWKRLCDAVALAKEADAAEEEDLGEIPDDFLDPLMATLMQDPVILPISRMVMDRSTIRQHLLSDPHDPYSRAPLKIDDVLPATEMKARIDAFKQERKDIKLAATLKENADHMDTS